MPLLTAVPEPVAHATHFPGVCIICRGTGPSFCDTGSDYGDAHVYICRSCGRDIGKVFGYVKGPRAEALDEASDRLTDAEKECAEATDAARKMAEELTRVQAALSTSQNALQYARDERDAALSRLQQIGGMVNETLVAANGGG